MSTVSGRGAKAYCCFQLEGDWIFEKSVWCSVPFLTNVILYFGQNDSLFWRNSLHAFVFFKVCVCACVCVRVFVCAKSIQSCLTLCNLMDYSPQGSCVHRDSPGKNAGGVAMPSSRGSS